jgi:RHS repeat-associated protein
VRRKESGSLTIIVGPHFEWNQSTGNRKYYYFNGERIAMRDNSGTLTYLHGDLLGSTSMQTNAAGAWQGTKRFTPYGKERYTNGSVTTDRQFTGQRREAATGLYDYNFRAYSPVIGRFTSPDNIVPDPTRSEDWNRFSYVGGNPTGHTDPTGHAQASPDDGGVGCIGSTNCDPDEVWRVYETSGGNDQEHKRERANPRLEEAYYAHMSGESRSAAETYVVAEGISSATNWGVQNSAGGAGAKREVAALTKAKPARYNGPKPEYSVNDAHVPGRPGFNPKKTPLPSDAEEVYRTAVPNDPKKTTAWFGVNRDGQIYRYSSSNNGTVHFSGIDGVGDGVRNITDYARQRLKELTR